MIKEIMPNLYSIYVTLPNSPLKNLNSYVFKGKKRNLLVDTGFNLPECLASLQEGIAELKLDMERTDILLTHCHADHCGLVNHIASPASQIYMNAIDHKIANDFIEHAEEYWAKLEEAYVREGFPEEEMARSRLLNPARKFAADAGFRAIPIVDGQVLPAGDSLLRCVFTPGHTPGHMCFYGAKEKLMITGDHVLFDITPNITVWKTLPDALARYIDSLHKIKNYQVEVSLPGHRQAGMALATRVDELLRHHEERLQDAYNILAAHGPMHAYAVASKMTWDIRAKDWDDFPLGQKRFAVGEAIAHLVHLVEQGRIKRHEQDNVVYYAC